MATTLRTSGITLGSSTLDVTGSAPSYTARAWVNFNGQGTVAIRSSGNVGSITDYGVSDYGLNFTTAMPDANYAASCSVQSTLTPGQAFTTLGTLTGAAFTTTLCRVVSVPGGDIAAYGGGAVSDSLRVVTTVFR